MKHGKLRIFDNLGDDGGFRRAGQPQRREGQVHQGAEEQTSPRGEIEARRQIELEEFREEAKVEPPCATDGAALEPAGQP